MILFTSTQGWQPVSHTSDPVICIL